MRRFSTIFSVISLIMLSASIAPASAQGTLAPTLLAEITLGDSRNIKFPSIAATGQTITVGGGVSTGSGNNNTDAFMWTLAEQATNIGSGVSIGPAQGQADYSTVAMGAGPDGSLYAAWSSIKDTRIYLRHRDTSGAWGPIRTVVAGGFPIFPQIAVASGGEVFVIWQDIDKPLFIKASSDQGATWSRTFSTVDKVYSTPPMITSGPNGQVLIGYTTIDLKPAAAIWTGSGLDTEILSGSGADTTVSIGIDGKFYAAWRGLDDKGSNSGIFYAERQAVNSWGRSHLASGVVKGAVNVAVDNGGVVHIGWISNASGPLRFFYAFRPFGQAEFTTAASSNVEGLYNSRLAISSFGSFAHAALENFSGSKPYITYDRFSGRATSIGATPLIEGGATVVGGKTTAQVSFTNPSSVNIATTQVRWRWNAAPTDSANDSGGWQPYAATIAVPIPTPLLNSTTCTQSTLYTQLRDTKANLLEEPAKNDAILIDGVVQAVVDVHNPFLDIPDAVSGTASTAALPPELALSKGAASGGDPSYTRVPLIYLSAQTSGDCSGITSVAIGKSLDALESTYKSDGSGFSGLIPLPDLANLESGSRSVAIQLHDGAGNLRNFPDLPATSFTITYDDTKPTWNVTASGLSLDVPPVAAVTASSNVGGDILQNLTFTNIQATDTQYQNGDRHFWGVWIANSRTAPADIGDPLTSSSLKWKALAVPDSGTSFTIRDWSLATGLPSSAVTPGVYYIYVRLLDGAGNATDQWVSIPKTISANMFKVQLPFVAR
ncbi:MAG: hypothetical protein WCJ55_19435 [Chloroflexales bacterium]